MLQGIAKHAAFVTLYCTGIIVGLVAGIWLSQQALSADVAQLVGAFFGAVITVTGAFWLANHREATERESLRRILLDGLQKLLDQANESSNWGTDSEGAKKRAWAVFSRWECLAAFSPYRQLDNFTHIQAMAEVDANCRQLTPHLESVPVPATTADDSSFLIGRMMAGRRHHAAIKAVDATCKEIADSCDSALRALSKGQISR